MKMFFTASLFTLWIFLLISALKAKNFELAITLLLVGLIVAYLPLWAAIVVSILSAIGYYVFKKGTT